MSPKTTSTPRQTNWHSVPTLLGLEKSSTGTVQQFVAALRTAGAEYECFVLIRRTVYRVVMPNHFAPRRDAWSLFCAERRSQGREKRKCLSLRQNVVQIPWPTCTPKVEVAHFSETSANIYQATRPHIPEECPSSSLSVKSSDLTTNVVSEPWTSYSVVKYCQELDCFGEERTRVSGRDSDPILFC
jgi:hypothetical protein